MSAAQPVNLPGLSLLAPTSATELSVVEQGERMAEILLSAPSEARPGVRCEVPLGQAVGYWHPAAGNDRSLPPDWAGRTTTSLVRSAPLGVLHDAAGGVLAAWAADHPIDEMEIRFGVSEEHKTFVVELSAGPSETASQLRIRLLSGGELADVVTELAGWMSGRIGEPPLPVPALARRPVYSSWYTFTQDISAEVIEVEAEHAAGLGCGSVFLDDGWQQLAHGRGYQGLGDWQPDEDKFPDLAGHVARLHERGLGVALWVAPLLLGKQSRAYSELQPYAPHWAPDLNCHILDPRFGEVREHLAEVCLRLVTEFGVDALKVDFLDTAMHYRGTAGSGDLADVGVAMAELLAQLRRRLVDAGRGDVLFEFRQPYVSPAISRYGQILRAADCPADAVLNRQRTIDARLLAVGPVIHSDPLMWGPTGGAVAVAQQLYAALFSVPQISMRLVDLEPEQSVALGGLLAWWEDHAEILLDGRLRVYGAETSYSVVSATRRDLGRAVVAVYVPQVVDLDVVEAHEISIVNATATPRLALRSSRHISSVSLRDSSGHSLGGVEQAEAAGLHELSVPAWGSATVVLDAGTPSASPQR
jgi:alpha-galactosidase